MEPASGSTKSSAAYGHACSNCVKAKCRCVPREGNNCERCYRLSKDCQPATFVRKRGVKKSASTRTSQLEDKLDNLVTLLQAQNSAVIPPTSTNHPALPTLAPTSFQTLVNRVDNNTLPTPIASEPASHPSPLSDEEGRLLNARAEQELFVFRTKYLEFFPFMHISPDTTAEQLQRERPFLYKAIVAACTKWQALQNNLGKQVREEIAMRVVANAERNLDLLLGSFVCMAWQFYFTKAKPCLGMFLSVARSLISDLKIDRPPCQFLACPKLPSFGEQAEYSETRTDEERRAVIACFALSAMISMSLRYDTMRWSPQLEESCSQLEHSAVPGDKVLVAIARISKVASDAVETMQRLSENPDQGSGILLHIKTMRASLDDVRRGLTTEQLQHKAVLTYLYSAEVVIHEAALFWPLIPRGARETLDARRTEYLLACLYATKSALDNFLSIDFFHMNMATILSFSHSTQVLYKLSVLEFPGWDRVVVRATADVLWYLEQCGLKIDEAMAREGENNPLFKAGEAMRETVAAWSQGLDSAGATLASTDLTGDAAATGGLDPMDMSWMNYGDDVWFPDVFARFN